MWLHALRKKDAMKDLESGFLKWRCIWILPRPSSATEKFSNLFDMYAKITGENPYETPMRIYPAVHYTMGGLWVDYDLMTTIPGLYALGEANFSDHGANRLGASALMQGLVDGYFVIPNTIAGYLSPMLGTAAVPTSHPAFTAVEDEVRDRTNRLLAA